MRPRVFAQWEALVRASHWGPLRVFRCELCRLAQPAVDVLHRCNYCGSTALSEEPVGDATRKEIEDAVTHDTEWRCTKPLDTPTTPA